MPITEQNIVRHELIGLDVEISGSKDPKLIGLAGVIIDETKKMLKIRAESKELSVEKSICVFRVSLPSGKIVEIDGNLLVGRPEERIKKKLPKKWG